MSDARIGRSAESSINKSIEEAEGERIHLIGICGTAMATLAALLRHRGAVVSGSDAHVYPPMSDFLAREGIPVLDGYDASHITDDIDIVVVGNAVSRGNVELEAVLDRRLRYTSLPELLRDRFLWDARSIVIAGTHGKTTTTALAGWLLTAGGADPTVFVGGIARNFGDDGASYRLGRATGPFVIEGDEYDSAYFDKTAKFLKYVPAVAVVGNVEFDHADIYPDVDAVVLAFKRLVNLVPRSGLLLLGVDSPHARALAPLAQSRVQTFGLTPDATWHAADLVMEPDATSFTVWRAGSGLGHWRLPLAGAHNVRNALAAIAIGAEVGIPADRLRGALATFRGVKRRLELVGTARAVTVYDDFAHHPTAVSETLAAVRAANPGARIWAVFEPRSASSCRRIFQHDFARAFALADRVVIASVFRSSLPPAERLSEDELVAELRAVGVDAAHVPEVGAIVDLVSTEARAGDLVIVMSNGAFDGIHRKLLEAL